MTSAFRASPTRNLVSMDMGSWSTGYFQNDTALDFLAGLEYCDSESFVQSVAKVVQEFRSFEVQRSSGNNVRVRTLADANEIINAFAPPLSGPNADAVLYFVGKEVEYPGDEETLRLVAASALILELRRKGPSLLPTEFKRLRSNGLHMSDETIGELIQLLRRVPLNKTLCRDFGVAWKRGVATLTRELEACKTASEPRGT